MRMMKMGNNERYTNAYFNYYKNKHVWRHGDYILIHKNTGGVTFYGRSDAVLKPSGVRIGTSEIYNIVEEFKEINDSLAIINEFCCLSNLQMGLNYLKN